MEFIGRDIDTEIRTEDIVRLRDYHTRQITYWKTQEGPGVDMVLFGELHLKNQYTKELKRREDDK